MLTEQFITAMKDEAQQDSCNQLNRRTEFMVLRTTYGMFDDEGKLKSMPKPKTATEAEPAKQEDNWF